MGALSPVVSPRFEQEVQRKCEIKGGVDRLGHDCTVIRRSTSPLCCTHAQISQHRLGLVIVHS